MAQDDPYADIRPSLPPTAGIRSRKEKLAWGLVDLALAVRRQAMGVGRVLDRLADDSSPRRVLVLGIYGERGADPIAREVERLRSSVHDVRFALGAMGETAPGLADETAAERLSGGKFANLNRLAEASAPRDSDWIVLIDDDVELPRRFLDRLLVAVEAFGFDLAQPALTRASHTAWEVTRQQSVIARRTGGVESGPVTLMSRAAFERLTPFDEYGMGWGLDLHWAAVAEAEGWRTGIVDAVPVRHERRPAATGYRHAEALAAAAQFLRAHEHLPYRRAAAVLDRYDRLP